MNREMDNNNLVDKALSSWEVQDPLPPRFAEQVWRRIERLESRGTLWQQFSVRVTAIFLKPSVAVSYATILLAAGLLAGYLQARGEKMRTAENLGDRYVQVIDPYQTRH